MFSVLFTLCIVQTSRAPKLAFIKFCVTCHVLLFSVLLHMHSLYLPCSRRAGLSCSELVAAVFSATLLALSVYTAVILANVSVAVDLRLYLLHFNRIMSPSLASLQHVLRFCDKKTLFACHSSWCHFCRYFSSSLFFLLLELL